MTIKNVKRWAPQGVVPYAVAIAAIAIAFGVRYALHPLLQGHFPFITFLIGAFLIEFFFGLGPSLFVIVIGLAITVYFFIPPFNTLLTPEPMDLIITGGYILIASVGIFLIESLQRSRYEARLLQEIAQSRLEMLQRSEAGRAHAEETARASEERFHAFASGLPQVWYMRRHNGNFEYVNDQFYEYTGLVPGSLESNGWLKAIHPDDIERVKAEWNQVAETGEELSSRFRLRMADDSYRYFTGKFSCVQDKHGKIIKWIGVTADTDAFAQAVGRS
jgi:PAS domain S-box-containing protein